MRKMIMMRGAPGTGKSTVIRALGLTSFCLSPDDLRLAYGGLVLNEAGEQVISQKDNRQVWLQAFRLLETRMSRGELLVMDATHCKERDMNPYIKLAERYQYQLACMDFSSMPLDRVLKQNRHRPAYKFVPEDIVRSFYESSQEVPVPERFHRVLWQEDEHHITQLQNWLCVPLTDLSSYRKIHHIGDLQGCHHPLKTYLKEGIHPEDFYIFLGDICDRGPENAKTLRTILSLAAYPNVVVMFGNHETHLHNWVHDLEIRSDEFKRRTLPQLLEGNLSRAEVEEFLLHVKESFPYRFHDKKVLVTHGGLSTVPPRLEEISLHQCAKGVGSYRTDIDAFFSQNAPAGWYQVHGHRNTEEVDIQASPRSFNLEGKVEYGGHLRILLLDTEGFHPIEIRNPHYTPLHTRIQNNAAKERIYPDWVPASPPSLSKEQLQRLRGHTLISEKTSKSYPDISSFNFTRDAFFKAQWDEMNIIARGLFIHTTSREIVARSYDKFFNYHERPETRDESLRQNISFPLIAYRKYNGYLGILGYDRSRDQLFFASKSTPEGEFAARFQRIFSDQTSRGRREYLRRYLKETHSSLVFEVIDPDEDPHIISYPKATIVLLDCIYRHTRFQTLPYKKLCRLAQRLHIPVKEEAVRFANWNAFQKWYQHASQSDWKYKDSYIEGFVLSDQNHFSFKIKGEYYSFWKRMRSLKDRVLAIRNSNKPLQRDLSDPRARHFYEWCLQQHDDTLRRDLIFVRTLYEENRTENPLPPPKPKISRELQGFQSALDNLTSTPKIKAQTADALLLRALNDPTLLEHLKHHPIKIRLIMAATHNEHRIDAAIELGIDLDA